MNKTRYRLVFNRTRGMLVAVEETATGAGKKSGQTRAHSASSRVLFTLRQLAFAAPALAMPALSSAQIAGGGAHAPNVIQTPNGIEQVNINRPSGAGVSVNTYNRFDVQQRGAILNNSPTMVQSQLGGMINGNPNFAPGQAAKVIVNQVNSASASQFNGALEVAGQRANVILANPSGIPLPLPARPVTRSSAGRAATRASSAGCRSIRRTAASGTVAGSTRRTRAWRSRT